MIMLVSYHLQNVGIDKGKTTATPSSTTQEKSGGGSPPSLCSVSFPLWSVLFTRLRRRQVWTCRAGHLGILITQG